MRCRASRRRSRAGHGSRQAETGSPASQRSTSSASARAERYRSSGRLRHRLQADGLQGRRDVAVHRSGWRERAAPSGVEDPPDVASLPGGLAGQDGVERRPEAVDVAGRAGGVRPPVGLLRAHVRRGADRGPDHRLARRPVDRPQGRGGLVEGEVVGDGPDELGQAPIDDERLAEGAQEDVRRLQVAVQDAPVVRVGDRVADVDESAEQVAEGERPRGGVARDGPVVEAFDGPLEALAADEPHGVERAAAVGHPQAVDRDDARVLEPGGDLGLEQESGPALRAVRLLRQDLLERDLAVQLGVDRDRDEAQPPPLVVPDPDVPRGRRRRPRPVPPARRRRIPVGLRLGRLDGRDADAAIQPPDGLGQPRERRVIRAPGQPLERLPARGAAFDVVLDGVATGVVVPAVEEPSQPLSARTACHRPDPHATPARRRPPGPLPGRGSPA